MNTPKIVTVEEMIAIERAADQAGWTYNNMMKAAGKNLALAIKNAHSQSEGERIFGLVGKGNNGGDTLIALADLASQGWSAIGYILAVREEGDELIQIAKRAGVVFIWQESDTDYGILREEINKPGVVLDGILGTGIRLPIREPAKGVLGFVKSVIEESEMPPMIVAVDCPSGVDCDTGEIAQDTLQADLTVCMAAVKIGMLKFPAFGMLGNLQVVGIGLPDEFPLINGVQRFLLDGEYVKRHIPIRPMQSHKGTYGTCLIAAGSRQYPGAALLAGRAAYRSGAGLVTMAVPKGIKGDLAGHLPEATWVSLAEEDGAIDADAGQDIDEMLMRVSSMLIGPGFGLAARTQLFMERILTNDLPPLVIDADGLKLLANIEGWQKEIPPQTILTPHPGEMAILTGESVGTIQSQRIDTAEKYAGEWGHVVVLKGANTVIASPEGKTAVLPVATSALASAGTGDVLAGLIAGLRAQGIGGFEAAAAGVWIHAQAGLRAAELVGSEAGLMAGDLIDLIPQFLGN